MCLTAEMDSLLTASARLTRRKFGCAWPSSRLASGLATTLATTQPKHAGGGIYGLSMKDYGFGLGIARGGQLFDLFSPLLSTRAVYSGEQDTPVKSNLDVKPIRAR